MKGLKVVGEVCGCLCHSKENNTNHKKGATGVSPVAP